MDDQIILRGFADNPALMATVKEIVMRRFSMDDPTQLQGLDNESIGEIIRARLDGREKVEDAFGYIAQFRTVEKRLPKINQAR